ncbi:MAG TPA: TIGR03862 family flavoprotein [Chthoniobacterales bacterium]
MKQAVAAVIGAGPAGLRAAELLATAGLQTRIFEQKPSLGRKLLVAGRGGLNLTHSEAFERFYTRYDEPKRWEKLLKHFTPATALEWYAGLGVNTFVGTSGRVFPRTLRAPAVLELWLERLDGLGCDFQTSHRFHHLIGKQPFDLVFQRGDQFSLITCDIVVFALGGGSWPQTGSDGNWVSEFRTMGIRVDDFVPSNVGWEYPWSENFLAVADGKPLKNLAVTGCGRTVRGELLITRYGLEGGALYALSQELRQDPEVFIDFKPDFTVSELRQKLKAGDNLTETAQKSWNLSTAAATLIQEVAGPKTSADLVKTVKRCRLRLDRPRPLAEAISSAGGVAWSELDDNLMLKKHPGLFCAGEMIGWDAPTGGYLLQGCLVTGTVAGQGAVKWIAQSLNR